MTTVRLKWITGSSSTRQAIPDHSFIPQLGGVGNYVDTPIRLRQPRVGTSQTTSDGFGRVCVECAHCLLYVSIYTEDFDTAGISATLGQMMWMQDSLEQRCRNLTERFTGGGMVAAVRLYYPPVTNARQSAALTRGSTRPS